MTEIEELFQKLKVAPDAELCELELDIFGLIYDKKEQDDTIAVFLALSNWVGFSLRDGVWTFYEYTDVDTIEKTIRFLNKSDCEELQRMFELGNHDYHNEIYAENYDYPEEWIIESETIDDWIFENEIEIYRKLKDILLENEAIFIALEKKEIVIRMATPEDAPKLLEIYAPYVENTAITFEYDVPSVEEFQRRIGNTLQKYPYLVAERAGEIMGYAYASSFHTRAAYAWAVETTVYVKQDRKKLGIGRQLYEELERLLKLQNILNLYACIAYPEKEDEHLTKDSVRFHERLGFELIGEFHKCGFKFNRWYNMVWMEKHIGEHTETPGAVKRFGE